LEQDPVNRTGSKSWILSLLHTIVLIYSRDRIPFGTQQYFKTAAVLTTISGQPPRDYTCGLASKRFPGTTSIVYRRSSQGGNINGNNRHRSRLSIDMGCYSSYSHVWSLDQQGWTIDTWNTSFSTFCERSFTGRCGYMTLLLNLIMFLVHPRTLSWNRMEETPMGMDS